MINAGCLLIILVFYISEARGAAGFDVMAVSVPLFRPPVGFGEALRERKSKLPIPLTTFTRVARGKQPSRVQKVAFDSAGTFSFSDQCQKIYVVWTVFLL